MTSTSNPLKSSLRATTETLQETGQRTFAVVLLCLVLEPHVLQQEGHTSQVLQIRYTYLVPFLSGLGNKFLTFYNTQGMPVCYRAQVRYQC